MESRSDSIPLDPGEVAFPSHVAYLRQHFTSQGLSEWVANMLLYTWRTQDTHSAYKLSLEEVYGCCGGKEVDPF